MNNRVWALGWQVNVRLVGWWVGRIGTFSLCFSSSAFRSFSTCWKCQGKIDIAQIADTHDLLLCTVQWNDVLLGERFSTSHAAFSWKMRTCSAELDEYTRVATLNFFERFQRKCMTTLAKNTKPVEED